MHAYLSVRPILLLNNRGILRFWENALINFPYTIIQSKFSFLCLLVGYVIYMPVCIQSQATLAFSEE